MNLNRHETNCKNCGAPLPAGFGVVTCSYCGTSYRYEGENVVVVHEHPEIIPIESVVRVPKYMYKYTDQEIQKYVQDGIVERIAHYLAGHLNIEMVNGPDWDFDTYRARIRVLDNDFRF